MVIIICSIFIGLALGFGLPITISAQFTPYIAAALLAGFDTIIGGYAAYTHQKFEINMFLTGFFSNVLLACAIILIGNIIGIDLSIAVIIVFGTRLFNNFSKIRQKLLQKRYEKCKIKEINAIDEL